MKNGNVKKLVGGFMMSLCLMGVAVPVHAQTVPFNITVPGDIISPKAGKADSEQKFYVTGNSFNKTGTLNCTSIQRDNSTVKSNSTGISSTKIRSNAGYRKYAVSGAYYYMSTSSSTSGLKVTGNYTP